MARLKHNHGYLGKAEAVAVVTKLLSNHSKQTDAQWILPSASYSYHGRCGRRP